MATRKSAVTTDGESPIFAAAKQIKETLEAVAVTSSDVVKFDYKGKLLTAKVNANKLVQLRAARLIPGRNIQSGELFALPPAEAISLVSDGFAFTTQEGTFSEEDVKGVRD